MTLLLIFTFKFFDTEKTIFFHISGLIINLIVQMSPQAISLVFSFGITIIILNKLPKLIHLFNHAIFHVFVLLGSFCHFASIYLYIN